MSYPPTLHVISPIFNPLGFRRRRQLFREFAARMEATPGIAFHPVEVAIGNLPFEVTDSFNPRHVQLRTRSEIWHKEAAMNVGVAHLPSDWSRVAFIDGDMIFTRPDWAEATLRLLERYPIIQMWSELQDTSSDYERLDNRKQVKSYVCNYVNGVVPDITYNLARMYPGGDTPPRNLSKEEVWYGPPGLAWAMRRETFDALGGLIDWAIVGAGDSYMASALIGGVEHQLRRQYHPNYVSRFMAWQERAQRAVRRHVGYLPGLAIHYYHGSWVNRQYGSREAILSEQQFNPETDLKRDWQGLWQLHDDGSQRFVDLRDRLIRYFMQRNEDA